MKKINVSITGIRPIIMHNGRTADPLNPWAKKVKVVTSISKKTEEDHIELGNIEFEAGLYWNDDLGVYIPSENLQKMFIQACRKKNLGPKSFGIMIDHEIGVSLNFPNCKKLENLKADPAMRFRKVVVVGVSKVVRTRPIIPTGWKASITVALDESIFPIERFVEICDIAGFLIGLGDWRPSAKTPGQFGRFTAKVEEIAA